MPSVIKHLQFICGSATKVAEYVGFAYELVFEKTTKRPHVMNGMTAGGHPLAFQSELLTEGPTLQQTAIDQALTSLGVYDALEELVTEYGGTVSETNSVSSQSADNPWADLS